MSQTFLPYDSIKVAEQIHAELQQALKERCRATLAIPGGRSPGHVLKELARRIEPELRANLHLLFLDERAVPLGNPDRNDDGMLAAWKEGGDLPAFVYPMPAELSDLEGAAKAYDQTLAEATEGGVVDVCLIGIGEDGHMASLFPNHPGLKERRNVFSVTDSPKPPPRRLTLSLPVIAKARLRIVLALGEGKWAVAKLALAKPGDTKIPCSLLPADGTYWYTDDPSIS